MTEERMGQDERAEAYLDGELSREEAEAFERDLAAHPEAADALGAAVVLRDLLGRMPPLEPPPGLEQRILGALRLGRAGDAAEPRRADPDARPSSVPPFRAALSGAGWLFRPSAAVVQAGMESARPIAAGLTQVRWLLGPLAPARAEPEPPRPLWRRALGRLGRLG
jgi:anti-sigma factor RsiW